MIKLSFLNLFRRKSRTFLSVLGIAIGVAAIIGLISVVAGVQQEYEEVMSSLQGIWAWEKGVIDQTLSKVDADDAGKIASMSGIRAVVPEVWVIPEKIDGGDAASDDIMNSPMVYGVDLVEYNKLRSNVWIGEIGKGSMLKPGDTGQVIIGKSLSEDRDKFIGSRIKVNDKSFRVKGIIKDESMGMGGMIFMSAEDAREISGFPSNKVSSFYVELVDPSQDIPMAKKLEFRLGDDYDIMTTSDMSDLFSGIMESFNVVVLLVGGLAAFVAGVGIINTILMSVLERMKELGALMATGWTGENLMKMIMYESLFIGIFGGIAGIALGYFASYMANAYGLPSVVTLDMVAQAFIFAVLLGLGAGVYPAYRASKLNPIEAIHGG